MALSLLIDFLFGSDPAIGEIKLDVSINEHHSIDNDVTQYPVEEGADLTDHIRPLPQRITMTGFITNSPLVLLAGFGLAARLEKRTLTAYNELKRIAGREKDALGNLKPPQLVTIVTSLDVYTNMALERLEIPRDKTTGDSIYFTAEFVQVEKPSSESVLIPGENLSTDDTDIAESASSVGRQSANTVSSNTPASNKTLLKAAADVARGK